MVSLPHHVIITVAIKGKNASEVDNYGVFFVATRACKIVAISEAHSAKSTDTSEVTLQIERLRGEEKDGEGCGVLNTPFDLKGNCEVAQEGNINENCKLKPCDRLNLLDYGTPTSVANVCVTIELELER